MEMVGEVMVAVVENVVHVGTQRAELQGRWNIVEIAGDMNTVSVVMEGMGDMKEVTIIAMIIMPMIMELSFTRNGTTIESTLGHVAEHTKEKIVDTTDITTMVIPIIVEDITIITVDMGAKSIDAAIMVDVAVKMIVAVKTDVKHTGYCVYNM